MQVYGKPDLSILAFGAPEKDADSIAAGMAKRDWVPGMVRTPPGLHLMMSLLHEPAREPYLKDLAAAVAEAAPARGRQASAVY
jgi:hypothetical protein